MALTQHVFSALASELVSCFISGHYHAIFLFFHAFSLEQNRYKNYRTALFHLRNKDRAFNASNRPLLSLIAESIAKYMSTYMAILKATTK